MILPRDTVYWKPIADILRPSLVSHKVTMAFHSEIKGLTERDELALRFVNSAFNSSRHDTTGLSTLYVLYGREPTMPLDTLLAPHTHPCTKYAHEAIARADEARHLARSHLAASQISQKTRYDVSNL